MGHRVSAFTIRDEIASALDLALSVRVYPEQPDSLTPEAVTVEWQSSTPAELPGMMQHYYSIVAWPYTDLTTRGADSHYASRDRLVDGILEELRTFSAPKGVVLDPLWEAAPEDRELGQQTVRVAVVTASAIEAVLC
jgi:hypothetical protein